jgi:hypothetical protein
MKERNEKQSSTRYRLFDLRDQGEEDDFPYYRGRFPPTHETGGGASRRASFRLHVSFAHMKARDAQIESLSKGNQQRGVRSTLHIPSPSMCGLVRTLPFRRRLCRRHLYFLCPGPLRLALSPQPLPSLLSPFFVISGVLSGQT